MADPSFKHTFFDFLKQSIGIGRKKQGVCPAYRIIIRTESPDTMYDFYKDEDGDIPSFETREEADDYLSSLPGYDKASRECFLEKDNCLLTFMVLYTESSNMPSTQ